MKAAVLNGARLAGVNSVLRAAHRKHLLVVLYHGVISAPRDPLGYCVHLAEFRRQIELLSQYFRPVSLEQVIAAAGSGASLPARALLVTFDDGYRNNLANAAPVLLRYGVPAVFHVATGYIGADRILWVEEIFLRILHWPGRLVPTPGGPDCALPPGGPERTALARRVSLECKDLPETGKQSYLARLREVPVSYGEDYLEEAYAFMSWDEVRRLREQGFEVGSHTVNHPILSGLPDHEAAGEMVESKRVIESQSGAPCLSVAYPNGRREDVSDAALEGARKAGYKAGFFVMGRFNRTLAEPLRLTRINIPGYLPEYVFHSRISGLLELRG